MRMRNIALAAAVVMGATSAAPLAFGDENKTSDPVEKTKMGSLPYTKAPETIGDPKGTRLTGNQITAKFKGRRTVFVGPQEQGIMQYDADTVSFHRATGPEVKGTWAVKNDTYCVTWAGAEESCYIVYQDAPNSYSLWLKNRPAGRVSIH